MAEKETAVKPAEQKKSATYVMMIIAFAVVTLWLVLSIFKSIGPAEIHAFSGTEAMAYLAPVFSLYFGRRYTEAKLPTPPTP